MGITAVIRTGLIWGDLNVQRLRGSYESEPDGIEHLDQAVEVLGVRSPLSQREILSIYAEQVCEVCLSHSQLLSRLTYLSA